MRNGLIAMKTAKNSTRRCSEQKTGPELDQLGIGPLEAAGNMAERTGFEPATPFVTGLYSSLECVAIQLEKAFSSVPNQQKQRIVASPRGAVKAIYLLDL